MTPQEIQKIQAYLRKTLDARLLTIKSRPKKANVADLLVDEKLVGLIEVDDEDDELTYQVEIHVPSKPQPLITAELMRAQGLLRDVLGSKNVVLKPRLSPQNMKPLMDSCEVFVGKESLGTFSADKTQYVFQFPVFDFDLDGGDDD